MSEENKEKPFEPPMVPMVPIYGLDMARELGAIDSRLTRVENDIVEVKHDLKALDAKTDKMANAIHRLDERTKSMQNQITVIGGGILIAVIAGIVVQLFSK